jgi:hypothetical protein
MERPWDSVPTDRRCVSAALAMPAGYEPLPETRASEPEAEPTKHILQLPYLRIDCRCSDSERQPTRNRRRAAWLSLRMTTVEQLQVGRLRDKSDGRACKAPGHVTKDGQIGALTAEVAGLLEQRVMVVTYQGPAHARESRTPTELPVPPDPQSLTVRVPDVQPAGVRRRGRHPAYWHCAQRPSSH